MIQDTTGIDITRPTNGTNTPQHADTYHKGYFLNDKARSVVCWSMRNQALCLLAGKPNPKTFPFESITLKVKPPLGSSSTETTSLTIEGPDLDSALQYGPTPGLTGFVNWLQDFQSSVHKRKAGGWSVNVGTGSQDLMAKSFGVLLNPGDPVLIETPVYAGILPPLKALQARTIEVEVDDQGISAENLEQTMANWPEGEKKPKVVYVNPTGCNPSGCSHSRERKLAVLEVCRKYNLLIMEDDPYYFLAQTLIPSYFELETEVFPEGGHVVRFDSFSKLLAAGMRMGFATGPKEIIHAIDVLTAGACLHSSAVSQAVAFRLCKHWGIEGFLNHGQHVADFYAGRREKFEALAHKHLDGMAKWVSPSAGMFLWMDLSPAGVKDSADLIKKVALAKGVLAVPGFSFFPNGRVSSQMRLSFSLVDLKSDAEEGMKRLAEAIREWQSSNQA